MTTATQTSRAKSQALFDAASKLMPGGVSSPVRACGAVGGEPVFLDRAQGAYVFDVDGNKYIDLVGSWGPAIIGHTDPDVVRAVQETAAKGLSFGACCSLESQLAARIANAFSDDSVQMVRLVNSGTEATMSAVRLARGITRRDKIIKFIGNYHGHSDQFLVQAGSGAATFGSPTSPGVTEKAASDTLLAPYNDLAAVEQLFADQPNDISAIIVEPIAGNMGFARPADGFLEGLRSLCDKFNTLLIFDEVMTGFRVAWGGYQNICRVTPDLTTLGKVIGGGMPVAAYAGRRELMEQLSPLGPIYQAGTLSGNPVGMAAGIATLDKCAQPGFYENLNKSAEYLSKGLQEAAAAAAGKNICTDFVGGMLGLSFTQSPVRNFEDAKAADHEAFGKFFNAMLDRGVWLPPSSYEAMFISAAHTQSDLDAIIDAARDSFRSL